MQAIQRARWRVRDTLGERDRGMRREKERERAECAAVSSAALV